MTALFGSVDDLLEDAPHFEREVMFLIDEDVASRERGLVEMPDQRLLPERQRAEAVGVQLHDGRIVHTFEQILPVGIRRG